MTLPWLSSQAFWKHQKRGSESHFKRLESTYLSKYTHSRLVVT